MERQFSSSFVVFIYLAVLVTGIVISAAAQKPATAPKYDVANEVTIKGVVQEVREFQCPVSGGNGAHILVKTADSTVLVHLALSKFLKDYGFDFAQGDSVTVIGARTKIDGQEAILARQVDRGNQSFRFRDKAGKPLW
jgi:DNA/RNA endonuclease YhcR with UshA esterase domain